MNLRSSLNRLYYNMTIHDIRFINRSAAGNLSYNSVMYLDVIDYQENCTVSSLAETLRISKPAVTKKVNELIQLGFVVKTQSKADRRIHYLTVSDAVRKNTELYDRPCERALRIVEKEFDKEQLDLLCRILDTINEEVMKEDGE